jgi:DNA-directed RNA polymerase specialized sigma24 family protein
MVQVRATHHAQQTGTSSQRTLTIYLRRSKMMNPKNRKTNQVQGIDYDGMNQQEVADALGISRTAVQNIERRAYKKFKRALAKRLKHITDLL